MLSRGAGDEDPPSVASSWEALSSQHIPDTLALEEFFDSRLHRWNDFLNGNNLTDGANTLPLPPFPLNKEPVDVRMAPSTANINWSLTEELDDEEISRNC